MRMLLPCSGHASALHFGKRKGPASYFVEVGCWRQCSYHEVAAALAAALHGCRAVLVLVIAQLPVEACAPPVTLRLFHLLCYYPAGSVYSDVVPVHFEVTFDGSCP